MGYSVNAGGEWHLGHPLDQPAFSGGTAMPLLTHPIWLALDSVTSPSDVLVADEALTAQDLDGDLACTCRPYAAAKSSACAGAMV